MGRGLTATASFEEGRPGDLVGPLLAWGVPRLRDLPWRRTRDPWAILVSEVMLQQTHVNRVVPRWQRFLDLFATPAACASAPLGDVLREWEGLGYPRRARNLHATAGAVVERFDGRLPVGLGDLLSLPGIGRYTARAVRVFAFEQDDAVVDTNVARVLARSAGGRLTPRQVQAMADELVPHGDGWTWNQVMLDLGATVCTARSARCDECPIAGACTWTRDGRPDPDPAVGSAGVSRPQGRYEGSDRQVRGRVLKLLARGPIAGGVAPAMLGLAGVDHARVERLVADLVADGLVERDGDELRLPSRTAAARVS